MMADLRLPLAWRALLVLAGGAALGAQLLAPAPSDLASREALRKPAAFRQASAGPIASRIYAAIGAHPLFSPTREPWRPPPPPAPIIVRAPPPPPPPAPMLPRGYALIGMITTGGQSTALLRTGTGQTVRVVKGQILDGWTVGSVNEDRVTLQAEGTSFELGFPVIKNADVHKFPR